MNIIKLIKEDTNEYSLIGYIDNVIDKEYENNLYEWLNSINDFKGGLFSKDGPEIPRLQKWYQIDNEYFSKEWEKRDNDRWKSNPYEKELLDLQGYIENKFNNLNLQYEGIHKIQINSCLINKYRDGNDSIKEHKDSQSTFKDNPTILGLSLGDDRDIIFRRVIYDENNLPSIKKDKNKRHLNFTLNLKPGSLLIMAGSVQKYYSHEIQKEKNKKERYSLTFRQYYK
jgi:alkylated DNA repair dioxygenase AlkB